MIGYYVDQVSLNNLVKSLEKIGKVIGSKNMQLYRAKKFRQFAVESVENGNLPLKKLSEATIKKTGEHNPLWLTGSLVRHMAVRPVKGNAADCGYFANDGALVPNTKITFTKLAILHHTGYRIRTDTEKGNKYVKWLASQGLFDGNPKKEGGGKGFIVVPPRPFMLKAMDLYESKNLDMKAVDEFLNKLMKAPGETIV